MMTSRTSTITKTYGIAISKYIFEDPRGPQHYGPGVADAEVMIIGTSRCVTRSGQPAIPSPLGYVG
jgi:hypothetical protein